MPITYRIDQSARVIFITGNGVVTEEELIANQEALLQDPDCDPAFGRLSDLTGATDFRVSAAGMLQAYLNVGVRRAVVASDQPAGTGLAQLIQTARDFGDENLKVFNDLEDARRWLEL